MEKKVNIYKDCTGRVIRTGVIVVHGNRRGIVLSDEIEGQYVKFKNGYKLRVKDYASKLRIVNPGKSRMVEGGLIVDGARRF